MAHTSPTTGSAADRVNKAAIRATVVLENVARAYGVGQTQSGLMNSPGHRANILSGDVSHVGIGVVFGDSSDGRREMFVTQVFARIAETLTAEDAQAHLLERILRNHPQVRFDRALTVVASTFARRVAAGESAQSVSRWASAELRRMRTSFASVSTVVSAALVVEDVDARAELASGKISGVGVGVARGDHPVMGKGAYYIVYLLGQNAGAVTPSPELSR